MDADRVARTHVDASVYIPYGGLMSDTTTIRVDRATHEELKRLAAHRHSTVTETVARAVRLLRQDEIGQELGEALTDDEIAWLDDDLG